MVLTPRNNGSLRLAVQSIQYPRSVALMSKPCIDIETFTWINLKTDIFQGRHANTMCLYLEKVVNPTLNVIDTEHEEMSKSDEPAAIFGLDDMTMLRQSTLQAFTLSVQSLWERQLRGYLTECARELERPATYLKDLETGSWTKLSEHFKQLRGLPLGAFDSFPDLDLLQLLGNACRHGEGKSARVLRERMPDLWPNSKINVPRPLLERLTHAVIWFWEDHDYIYTNSIARKHPSVDKALAKKREDRARRLRPRNTAGSLNSFR
jgi:hypothetical protein